MRKSPCSVYQQLGVPDAAGMYIKARLVSAIAGRIKRRHLTRSDAATLLGFLQPKLSNVLRGQFCGVSERKLMSSLTKLGRDIQIVVTAASRSRRERRISVAVA